MLVLPNEIINQTLEELWNDTEALQSCLGTCKRIRELTHRVFYADITIDLEGPEAQTRRRLDRLHQVLPLAVRHVRVLRLRFGFIEDKTRLLANLILRVIAAQPTIKELYLRGPYDRMQTSIVPRLMMRPSLHLLSFYACHRVPVNAFQHRPALRYLQIQHSTVIAPFVFTDFYSTNASYHFDDKLPLDSNAISRPSSLALTLGLPKNFPGAAVLLQRSSSYLTSLSLLFQSIMPRDYEVLAGVTLDCFPALFSLSFAFEGGLKLSVPFDILGFLRGNGKQTKLRELHIIFDHTGPYFPDIMVIFPYILSSDKPFQIDEVFDRKMLPELVAASCTLQISVQSLHFCSPGKLREFERKASGEFREFFSPPDGMVEWVNLLVRLKESEDWDDMY